MRGSFGQPAHVRGYGFIYFLQHTITANRTALGGGSVIFSHLTGVLPFAPPRPPWLGIFIERQVADCGLRSELRSRRQHCRDLNPLLILITGLYSVVVPQNWQISGMPQPSYSQVWDDHCNCYLILHHLGVRQLKRGARPWWLPAQHNPRVGGTDPCMQVIPREREKQRLQRSRGTTYDVPASLYQINFTWTVTPYNT